MGEVMHVPKLWTVTAPPTQIPSPLVGLPGASTAWTRQEAVGSAAERQQASGHQAWA